MNETAALRSIVVERDMPHPPEKIWSALTEPHLIAEWLMKNELKPKLGHRFDLHFDWGVVECQVVQVEAKKTLSYTWGDDHLKSVVTWTLTPTNTGTHLRMEQTGFRPDQPRYFRGTKAGWPRFLAKLEHVLATMDD